MNLLLAAQLLQIQTLDRVIVGQKAQSPGVYFKSRHQNLLDATEALLCCDPEFDRQFAISLS